MNADNNDAIKVMAAEVKKCVQSLISKARFDRTIKGRILSYLGNNIYQVELSGQQFKAIAYDSYDINEIVYIKIASNDYNNLIIESSSSGKTNQLNEWTIETQQLDI